MSPSTHIQGASKDTWYLDGEVVEVLASDTAEGPKNAVRVKFAQGAQQKLILPEKLAETLEKI